MSVSNMVEQPKNKDQPDKAKNGVDQYSKLKRIEWPNSMDGNKFETEFTKTICMDNDKNIHALMALYKGIKDRNDKFCKKNNFDQDMFMITSLIYGEGAAREKFLKGEDPLKDQRISEVKQLFDYYKGLSLDERNAITGDKLSISIETWAGHYFHAGAETDLDHRETNLALAIITRWNNARDKTRVFDNAENVAKWFGGQIGQDPQCFSHFPGGISGIKWATYAGLINPTLGGKPELHKEIMTGAGREELITEKTTGPDVAAETKVQPEVVKDITTAAQSTEKDAAVDAQKKLGRIISDIASGHWERLEQGEFPKTVAKPASVAQAPKEGEAAGPQELTPGLKSDLEELIATFKRKNEQEIADLGGCLSTISKRLEKYSDPDFVYLKGQVDDAIKKLDSGGKLDANTINAMRECVNIILGIENEPVVKEAASVAPKTSADSAYTGPSLKKMPDQKVNSWALKMKQPEPAAKSGVGSGAEQKKSEKEQKIADKERERKADEDKKKREAEAKKYDKVTKEYGEVAEDLISWLKTKAQSPKVEYQLANVKGWKDYIGRIDTDGGILESLILYGPLDQIAFLADFAKNKAGYDAAKANLVSGVVPEMEARGTPYEGLINDLGDWLDKKKMDPKLMSQLRVSVAYLQSIDNNNKDLAKFMAQLGPQPQYDILEGIAKYKLDYTKAKDAILKEEVPKASLNAPVAPKDTAQQVAAKDSSRGQTVVSDSSTTAKLAPDASITAKTTEVTAYEELAANLKSWSSEQTLQSVKLKYQTENLGKFVEHLNTIDPDKKLLQDILGMSHRDQMTTLQNIYENNYTFDGARSYIDYVK